MPWAFVFVLVLGAPAVNAYEIINVLLILGAGFAAGYAVATREWGKQFDELQARLDEVIARVLR